MNQICLEKLELERYRSFRESEIFFKNLTVLIGPNSAGKSTVLNALALLSQGLKSQQFDEEIAYRGGFVNLTWKGEEASFIRLSIDARNDDARFRWSLKLEEKDGKPAFTDEEVRGSRPPGFHDELLLKGHMSKGNYSSGWGKLRDLPFDLKDRSLAASGLSIAGANPQFPGRPLAEFVSSWGIYDPIPIFMRKPAVAESLDVLPGAGDKFASRILTLWEKDRPLFERWVQAVQDVLQIKLGGIEPKKSDEGLAFLLSREKGLRFRIHQMGFASGTLRIMGLLAVLVAPGNLKLVGIEEPENFVHPTALEALANHLREASQRLQVVITTHSTALLDFLGDPADVVVVERREGESKIIPETDPDGRREVLQKSGMALGEYWRSRGFGVSL